MSKKIPQEPVPWIHKPSSLASSWTWDTPHFTVTIFAEGMMSKPMYNWKISDKSSGFSKPFENGIELSFAQAVNGVLEVIGKSYPRTLGYQAYAGALATTFTIADGKKYDFGSVIGETVILKALDADNREVTITGIFDIIHYEFAVSYGDSQLMIPPSQVVDVLKEFGRSSLIKYDRNSEPTRTSTGRIVHEEWQKGCTGKPGFRPGTTVHPPDAPYCSIHNI